MPEEEGAGQKGVCDENTLSDLYRAYSKELYHFLVYRFGDAGEARDLVQDAFVKLWEQCKKVSLESARGFLYTVARNLSLNRLKHEKVVIAYQNQQPGDFTSRSPEFEMEYREYWAQYQAALGALPEDQRVAFLLNKAEGKSHQEIADMMGITRKSVEYKIYTAFTVLKTKLEHFNIK